MIRRSTMVVLALALQGAHAFEAPGDFAMAIPLMVDGRNGLYEVVLPAAVHEGVVHSDLRDLRVFNGADEVVPHALRPRAAPTKIAAVKLPATIFPLHAERDASLDEITLRVGGREHGRPVDVRVRDRGQGERILRGYLFRTPDEEKTFQAVQLSLQGEPRDLVSVLRLEASDDLAAWRDVKRGAPVVSLASGGERLRQDRIEFAPTKSKFWRLTWEGDRTPVPLSAVVLEIAEGPIDLEREWKTVAGVAVQGKPGEFSFDLGGTFPADRIRLRLPDANTVAVIELLGQGGRDNVWRSLTSATVYRLNRAGAEVTSPDLPVSLGSLRQLRIRVDPRGGGLGSGSPSIEIGWVPQRLVFVARGAPPFQLVYGSARAQHGGFAIEKIVPGFRWSDAAAADAGKADERRAASSLVARASLEAPRALAGDAARRPPLPVRAWILWATLLAGAGLLVWMALRLARQVNRSPAGATDRSPPGTTAPPPSNAE